MISLDETFHDSIDKSGGSRRRVWCEMSIHPVMQPLRNAANSECGGGNAMLPGDNTYPSEGLRPDAWHHEEIHLSHQRGECELRNPTCEFDRQAWRRRFHRSRTGLPRFSLGTVACENHVNRTLERSDDARKCFEQVLPTLKTLHASGK